MVPFRALLGETAIAVRAPALLASLLIGLFLLPLVRRLGGGPRQAAAAYLLLHAMPAFLLGSSYASTDVAMSAAYVAATWAAVALAQGERRAWWGFGLAIGLGFLAKFPTVLVLPALLPALLDRSRGHRFAALRDWRPWLAGAVALALTAPVWLWAAAHHWDNLRFQLVGRHQVEGFTLRHLGEFLGANLLLASPRSSSPWSSPGCAAGGSGTPPGGLSSSPPCRRSPSSRWPRCARRSAPTGGCRG